MGKSNQKKAKELHALKRVIVDYIKEMGLHVEGTPMNKNIRDNMVKLIHGYRHNKDSVKTVGIYLANTENREKLLPPFCVMQSYRANLKNFKLDIQKHKLIKESKMPKVGKSFYSSRQWRSLRVDALVKNGRKCCLCGRSPKDGVILHVDHIKPISKFPELKLTLNNLQILCEDCNLGKSNRYDEDWRA